MTALTGRVARPRHARLRRLPAGFAAIFRCRPPSRSIWLVSARAAGQLPAAVARSASANIKRNAWPSRAPRNWSGTSPTCLRCTACGSNNARRKRLPGAGVPEFHAEAMRVLAEQGFVRLFLLKPAAKPWRRFTASPWAGRFSSISAGCTPGWVRYGLGQVLIGNAIEQSIGRGMPLSISCAATNPTRRGWADLRAREHHAALLRPAAGQRRGALEPPDFRRHARRFAQRRPRRQDVSVE